MNGESASDGLSPRILSLATDCCTINSYGREKRAFITQHRQASAAWLLPTFSPFPRSTFHFGPQASIFLAPAAATQDAYPTLLTSVLITTPLYNKSPLLFYPHDRAFPKDSHPHLSLIPKNNRVTTQQLRFMSIENLKSFGKDNPSFDVTSDPESTARVRWYCAVMRVDCCCSLLSTHCYANDRLTVLPTDEMMAVAVASSLVVRANKSTYRPLRRSR